MTAKWRAANSARAAWPSPRKSSPPSKPLLNPDRRLSGFKALVTAGPTHEPIDPVRYIANRSSGKQGYAIASALADAGADTVLVSGPVDLAAPAGVKLVRSRPRVRCGGVRGGTAGRYRGVRRGRRRLASRRRRPIRRSRSGRCTALDRADAKIPTSWRACASRASGRARHRLCRRDRRPHRQCRSQARRARAATGSSPTMSAAGAAWAATRTACIFSPRPVPKPGRSCPRPKSRAALSSASREIRKARGMKVAIQRLPHARDLPLPAYATAGSAGLDLRRRRRAARSCSRRASRQAVPTGIALALPEGIEAQVRPRSGLALKHGVTVLNAPGTIDSDYRGEVTVILDQSRRGALRDRARHEDRATRGRGACACRVERNDRTRIRPRAGAAASARPD